MTRDQWNRTMGRTTIQKCYHDLEARVSALEGGTVAAFNGYKKTIQQYHANVLDRLERLEAARGIVAPLIDGRARIQTAARLVEERIAAIETSRGKR